MPHDPGAPCLFPYADVLQSRLRALWPGTVVEVVPTTASTNDDLLQAARQGGLDAPLLRVAEHQSAGRGRWSRTWVSRRGDSLTFSLAVPLAPQDWSGLSLAVGVALAEALEPATGGQPRIGLKWPNDLWLRDASEPRGGRKLGGVLIETVASAGSRVAVVGVGLNARRQARDGSDSGLDSGLAGLEELHPEASPAQALALAAPALLGALARFEREGFGAFAPAYAARDLLAGREVAAGPAPDASSQGTLRGVARGVDASGRLLLRDADGRLQPVVAGEVSVRTADPVAA